MASVVITSFGYLHSLPPHATITADLRECLRDPHVDPALRQLTGHDDRVRVTVLRTPGATGLIAHLTVTAADLLGHGIPVTVGIGCAGGRHRSVVVAEDIAARLRMAGHEVTLCHRDVARPVVHRPHP